MPLASESKKKREQSFSSVFRDFGDILEIEDAFFGGAVDRPVLGRKDSVSSDCACLDGLSVGMG
jgi:hypothetical protein